MHSRISWTLVLAALLAGWWADSYQPRVRSLDVGWWGTWQGKTHGVFVKDGRIRVDELSAAQVPWNHAVHHGGSFLREATPPVSIGSHTFTSNSEASSIAIWSVILALAGVWCVRRGAWYLRAWRRSRRGLCLGCGYNLCGAAPGVRRCPECGLIQTTPFRALRLDARRRIWPAGLLAGAAAAFVIPMTSRMWHWIDPPKTLHEAAMWGRVTHIERLVRDGADVNERDPCGATPLLYAADGWPSATHRLLELGADAEIMVKHPWRWRSALLVAVRTGNTEIVDALLAKGADINALPSACQDCITPLDLAHEMDMKEMMRHLLRSGADPERSSRSLLWWSVRSRDSATVRLLLDHGADPNRPRRGWTEPPLTVAIGNCDVALVRLLLDRGANPADESTSGPPPLFRAIDGGQDEVVALLLKHGVSQDVPEHGVSLHSWNGQGISALHLAAYKRDASVIRLLLDAGAEVNRLDAYGRTALHLAGDAETVRLLLDAGALIDAQDYDGRTRLMSAAQHPLHRMVALLLDSGADPTLTDDEGFTAADLAVHSGMRDLAVTLRAAAEAWRPPEAPPAGE